MRCLTEKENMRLILAPGLVTKGTSSLFDLEVLVGGRIYAGKGDEHQGLRANRVSQKPHTTVVQDTTHGIRQTKRSY